ncbi:MAG: T9SS type A sorting domain-containing protein, partial [Chitinophagales bacterium]
VSLPSAEFTLSEGVVAVENANVQPLIANTNNTLLIQFEKNEHFSIALYSADGKKLYSESASGNYFVKSFAHLAAGIYQVVIKTERATFNSSLLIIQE